MRLYSKAFANYVKKLWITCGYVHCKLIRPYFYTAFVQKTLRIIDCLARLGYYCERN